MGIEASAQDFITSLEKIDQRRNRWKNETRELIVNKLEQLVKNYPSLKWNVQRLEQTTNQQTINIGWGPSNSGIVLKNESKIKAFTKHGGRLAFVQMYNGKVYIVILYPSVEEYVMEMDNKSLAALDPEDVTEEAIEKYVKIFLDHMAQWEGMDRKPLGF